MTQANFENLMKFWRQALDEEHKNFFSPQTAACLSFDDLKSHAEGHFNPIQQGHILTCSHCRKVVQLFEKHLETKPPTIGKALSAWSKIINAKIRELWQGLRGEGPGAIPKPALLGISLVFVAALLFLLLPRHEKTLAELASIEPVPYQALRMRSGASSSAAERLFEEGMAAYVQRDYIGAIAKLDSTVRRDSTSASFHFYLGLCYLLSKNVGAAIEHLQRTIDLGGNSVLEKAYWYLGNAWLLRGERDRALEAFRKVVEMEGHYQWEAEEVIGKIEKLSSS